MLGEASVLLLFSNWAEKNSIKYHITGLLLAPSLCKLSRLPFVKCFFYSSHATAGLRGPSCIPFSCCSQSFYHYISVLSSQPCWLSQQRTPLKGCLQAFICLGSFPISRLKVELVKTRGFRLPAHADVYSNPAAAVQLPPTETGLKQ